MSWLPNSLFVRCTGSKGMIRFDIRQAMPAIFVEKFPLNLGKFEGRGRAMKGTKDTMSTIKLQRIQ
jgi:hypothetical protein